MKRGSSQRRILIIDDNRDSADLLGEVLAMYGYATSVAYSGPSGLSALAEFRPGVVFLDIGMPEMDGYQVAMRIRQMPISEQPVLIAFTAWSDDHAKARVIEAGFDLHLTKPADFKVLLDIVARLPWA